MLWVVLLLCVSCIRCDRSDSGRRGKAASNHVLKGAGPELEQLTQEVTYLRDELQEMESEFHRVQDSQILLQDQLESGAASRCQCDDKIQTQGVQLRRLRRVVQSQDQAITELRQELARQTALVTKVTEVQEKQTKRVDWVESSVAYARYQTENVVASNRKQQREIDAAENTSRVLQQQTAGLEKGMRGVYADHGYFYSALDDVRARLNLSAVNSARRDSRLNLLQTLMLHVVRSLETALQNNTYWDSVFQTWSEYVDSQTLRIRGDRTDPRHPGNHPADTTETPDPAMFCTALSLSSCHQDTADIRRILDQLATNVSAIRTDTDHTSMDLEHLRDEALTYYRYLLVLENQVKLLQAQTSQIRTSRKEVESLTNTVSTLDSLLTNITVGLQKAGLDIPYVDFRPGLLASVRPAFRTTPTSKPTPLADVTIDTTTAEASKHVTDYPSTAARIQDTHKPLSADVSTEPQLAYPEQEPRPLDASSRYREMTAARELESVEGASESAAPEPDPEHSEQSTQHRQIQVKPSESDGR